MTVFHAVAKHVLVDIHQYISSPVETTASLLTTVQMSTEWLLSRRAVDLVQ